MKTKVVEITYKFNIKYGHINLLKRIMRDLKKEPIYDMGGASIIDGEAYSYSCKRVGKGRQHKAQKVVEADRIIMCQDCGCININRLECPFCNGSVYLNTE